MTISNNYHTAVIRGEWGNKNNTPHFWTSSEPNRNFVLDSIHFHWGMQDDDGSEHFVNSEGFALELHAIHYDQEMGTLINATSKSTNERKALRVISILFQVTKENNTDMDHIIEALKHVRKPGVIAAVEPFDVARLLLRFSNSYVTYNGSLTTPPCSEIVTWIIRLTPWHISEYQLQEFRKLEGFDGTSLSGNCRPIQPLNGRKIHHII